MDNALRTLIPSAARLSYNPAFRVIGDLLASAIAFPFREELKNLPPNHLRVRVGVGNRIVNNHVYHLVIGRQFWLRWLAAGHTTATSDIVEIGSGCGRIASPLLTDHWFSGSYVGVDIDPEMIAWCRNHFPQPRFSFVQSPHRSRTYAGADRPAAADAELSIAPPLSKDFVFATSLYTHLLEPETRQYLQHSYDMLRPGGTMLFTFFCRQHVALGGRWTFTHRIGNAYVQNMTYPEAAVAYDEAFITAMVKEAGFRSVEIIPNEAQSELVARK